MALQAVGEGLIWPLGNYEDISRPCSSPCWQTCGKIPAAKSEEFPLDDTKITWFGLKNEDGGGKQAQSPSQQQRKKRKLLDLRIGYLSP